MRKISTIGGGLFLFLVAGQAPAFSQRSESLMATGHEFLVVGGAHRMLSEPGSNEITGPTANCRRCDQYDTNSWIIWSLVQGNRWADIGGYSVVKSSKCFHAAVQDADGVQYQHALRKKCDAGTQGLKRAHAGTVALIRNRFMLAVSAADGPVWFSDGGAISLRYKARRPYFILGMAIHALQDTFSTEHSHRSDNWHAIKDLMTYVGTLGADHHANPDEHPGKFKVWGATPAPNETHGDYGFFHFAEVASYGDMKDSAKMAVEATADLVKAFDQTMKVPANQRGDLAKKLFDSLVYDKWLQLDSSVVDKLKALGDKNDALDPGCSAPEKGSQWGSGKSTEGTWLSNEDKRRVCLIESGTETSISPTGDVVGVFGEMPKFCWPESSCHDNTAQHIADGISSAAKSFGSAVASFGKALGVLAGEIATFGDHAKHPVKLHGLSLPTPDQCLGEATTHGVNSGDGFNAHGNQAASQYWSGVSAVLGVLDAKADRKAALDKSWNELKSSLVSQRSTTRASNCDKVRLFFFKDGSKAKGEANCQGAFDAHTSGLVKILDASYELNMSKGLAPPAAVVKPAPPPPDFTLTVAPPKKEAPKPVVFSFLQTAPLLNLNLLSLPEKKAVDLKPLVESSHAARLQCATAGSSDSLCEAQHNARLRLLGQQTAQPRASETAEQKAERFDAELQACLQSPLMAAEHGTAAPARCLAIYHNDVEASGIRPTKQVGASIYHMQASEHAALKVEPTWKLMSEGGQDVGFAPDGTIWLVGNKTSYGGFELKRSNTSHEAFRTVPGGGVRISVGGAGEVWVVNDVGNLYRRGHTDWEHVPGLKAKDVAVGADGSVWAIGTEKSFGGLAIYRFEPTNKTWNKVDGGGVRVAVDAAGHPWVVNDVGAIYERVENNWTKRPGSAKDIAVGADGSVWVIGTNASAGGNGIWHWNATAATWDNKKGGGGTNIAVGPMGLPCVVNDTHQLWCML